MKKLSLAAFAATMMFAAPFAGTNAFAQKSAPPAAACCCTNCQCDNCTCAGSCGEVCSCGSCGSCAK